MRQKRSANNKLQEKWGAPTPPWDDRLLANVIWNIHNTPASNISMVGRITGFTFAPVGACATFAVTLRLAMNAIRLGQAKAVVIGAADPPPHPLVGASTSGRVISADGEVSRRSPRPARHARLRWSGDLDHLASRSHGGARLRPIGLSSRSVGVSADAERHHHAVGGRSAVQAIREAIAAGVELACNRRLGPARHRDARRLAGGRQPEGASCPRRRGGAPRRGSSAHGMGASGGWSSAQYLGLARGRIFRRLFPSAT
jgi:hypothetical protein